MSARTDFIKHREETLDFSVNFKAAYNTTSDSIGSVEEITLTRYGKATDRSTEFGNPSGSISGDDVQVTLTGTTSTTQQHPAVYEAKVRAGTTEGDSLVGKNDDGDLPTIRVTDDG